MFLNTIKRLTTNSLVLLTILINVYYLNLLITCVKIEIVLNIETLILRNIFLSMSERLN